MTNHPMTTAPRDGRTVIVGHDDMGEHPMRWDAEAYNPLTRKCGLWVARDDTFTWCDHPPEYGPQYWREMQ